MGERGGMVVCPVIPGGVPAVEAAVFVHFLGRLPVGELARLPVVAEAMCFDAGEYWLLLRPAEVEDVSCWTVGVAGGRVILAASADRYDQGEPFAEFELCDPAALARVERVLTGVVSHHFRVGGRGAVGFT